MSMKPFIEVTQTAYGMGISFSDAMNPVAGKYVHESQLQALISGLEALAGELESLGVKGGSSWSAAQRIRTLASAGLEGNNNGTG